MAITPAQLARVERDWRAVTMDEPLRVEVVASSIYAFTSELGALRLGHKYRYAIGAAARPTVGYSENFKSWYFSLDVKPVA